MGLKPPTKRKKPEKRAKREGPDKHDGPKETAIHPSPLKEKQSRSPSLTDVARMADVSLTAASMVLNKGKQENRVSPAVADRIRKAAEKLGYIPNYHARSMKLGRGEVIAVALDVGHLEPNYQSRHSELALTYWGQMIGGIEVQTRNSGYLMTVVGPDAHARAPDRGLLGLRQRRFDGLIVPGLPVHPERTSFMLDSPDANIVVIEYNGRTQLPIVDFNELAGVQMAARHLSELGHREFLWVGNPEPRQLLDVTPRREQMFMQALQDLGLHGISCRPIRLPNPHGPPRGPTVDETEEAVTRLLQARPRKFTAVACFNDRVAIGVCSALLHTGLRVPNDVSVIGFDDVEAELCIPRLTTVSHKLHEMGIRATQLVFEMMNDPKARQRLRGTREWIQPELIIRKSTAPPPPI